MAVKKRVVRVTVGALDVRGLPSHLRHSLAPAVASALGERLSGGRTPLRRNVAVTVRIGAHDDVRAIARRSSALAADAARGAPNGRALDPRRGDRGQVL